MPAPTAFIDRWRNAGASERANAQQFLIELADLLGVPRPANDHADGYTFEFPVKLPQHNGTFSEGRIDLYKPGCFVLEAKQFADAQAAPELTLPDPDDASVERRFLRIPEFGGRVLRVAVNTVVEPPRVVSVFFNRAMKGKL